MVDKTRDIVASLMEWIVEDVIEFPHAARGEMRDAARLIESLSGRNDELLQKIKQLEMEFEQVTRERDAYLKSIEGLCAVCKHAPYCMLTPVERCKNWQWKGVDVEG